MQKIEGYDPSFKGSYIGPQGVMTNEDVCNILRELISSPSENGNEGPCADTIVNICKREGLTYEIVKCTDDRVNIMITVGASSYESRKHGILLHGHYDTVPFLDMEEPLSANINSNKMWGRGSVDQKGGLASAICAAIAIKRSGMKLKKPFCVACVIDEESEHRGSYVLAKSKVRADYAISTEPTGAHTALFGCRGTVPVKITVEGKTAHAGMPQLGINAIEQSLPILNELFRMKTDSMDLKELGTLQSTSCVSMMEAGTGYNNVPGQASIIMDRRTIPGETNETVLKQINDIIDKVRETHPDIKAKAEIARPDWKWEPIIKRGLNPTLTDVNTELFKILRRACIRSSAGKISKGIFHGYCDMDFLVNDLSIPTLVYGPGDPNLCHNPNEEVDIDEVCLVADVFCNMIKEICERRSILSRLLQKR